MSDKLDLKKLNILSMSNEQIDIESSEYRSNGEYDFLKIRQKIEPWLTAVFQSEHLSLLIGTGLDIALTGKGGLPARIEFAGNFGNIIKSMADEEAKYVDRETANFEDDLRVALELLRGLKILKRTRAARSLEKQIGNHLKELLKGVAASERKLIEKSSDKNNDNIPDKSDQNKNQEVFDNIIYLKKFLLSFASRAASRGRLNIFTTNYDRIIEFGLDEAGILTIDRFIGKIKPIMRLHRIDLDYHYNPPGIRGEPRYVEGVVKYTKLHGSIDWRFEGNQVVKLPMAFGQADERYFENPAEEVVIYPNSSKAIETAYFPYSELFRDFSTAICRPNSVLVTYGYGFGDSHINRIILDMLTVPSTHLVIISYDNASRRIDKFIKKCNSSQLTLLIGNHLGELKNLTENYLPKPAIDLITDRQARIIEKRKLLQEDGLNKNEDRGNGNRELA